MANSQRARTWLETGALLAVWAAAIAIIQPRGNFPMIDDWDFAIATWNFAHTGHFHFTEFTAVSLRAMVVWGALWTRLFGESFDVLRASTLTLSAITIAVVHRTLVRANIGSFARVVATLALLFHPIFLWASCTYMTDVPFVCVQAIAFYCFMRAFTEERAGFAVAGTVAVLVSCFIRQNGIFALAAVIVVAWFMRRRLLGAIAASGVAAFGVVFLTHRDWMSGTPAMFAIHYQMWGESSFRLPEQIALMYHYAAFNAVNCALFFLPLTLPLVAAVRPVRGKILLGVIAALLLFRTIDLARDGYLIPYMSREQHSDLLPGALVFDFGLGTPMLFDTFNLGHDYPFTMPHAARVTLTCGVALLAIALVWSLARTRSAQPAHRLALAWAVCGTCVLFASGYYYDRYSLDSAWTVAVALPFVLPWDRRAVRVLAAVALLIAATLSTIGVQENFAWNRARWRAFDDLRRQGIDERQIDAGAEAFALFELRNATRREARQPHSARKYAIAFTPLDGYRVLATYPWGVVRKGTIYALEKR